MAPRDKEQTKPALNYVRGRVIKIDLVHRQVQTVTVIDSAAGVYLEPQSDTVKKDSIRRAKLAVDTVPKYLRKKKAKAGATTTAPGDSVAPDSSPSKPPSSIHLPSAVPPSSSPPSPLPAQPAPSGTGMAARAWRRDPVVL